MISLFGSVLGTFAEVIEVSGAVVSTTVIVKLAVPVLPLVSVAEQVTCVLPSGKVLPDGGLQTAGSVGSRVVIPSTRSLAVTGP